MADETSGAAIHPAVESESGSVEFQPTGLDGDVLRWRVLRLRWEKT